MRGENDGWRHVDSRRDQRGDPAVTNLAGPSQALDSSLPYVLGKNIVPYKSDKQRKFMHAAADRGDISRKVVDEFDQASKGKPLPPQRQVNVEFKTDGHKQARPKKRGN